MAATVTSITPTIFATDTTSHLVAMPATVVAGELLICFWSNDGNAAVTTPSGWTQFYNAVSSTAIRGGAYGKIALGTEGGTTVDWVTASVEQGAAQVYRITGNVEALGAGLVEAGTAVGSSNAGVATIDPPGVTASWGALDNLFISGLATSTNVAVVSGPSGWTTPVKTNEGAANNTTSAQVYTTTLTAAAAAGDPGVWTLGANGATFVVDTIVIRPKIHSLGVPANTVAGALVGNVTTQTLSIPAVAAGRILLVTSHGRRPSTTLPPDDGTLSDTSAAPLTWTPVFSPQPSMVGVNPGTKAQWWWAVADGAAKTVTVTWPNAGSSSSIFSSVTDFAIGAGKVPSFVNQVWGANSGTPATVTVTYPIAPTTGFNFLSFYGAGGSVSTIATGYTTLTFVASTPYRTGYDLTPGVNAVMGNSALDQILAAVNITDDAPAGPQGAKAKVWSGSAWVEKPMLRWSGSAWVQEAPKVWSGTAWVSSPMPPWVGGATGPTTTMVSAFTSSFPRSDFDGEVGYLFRPISDMTVTWVGRFVMSANTGSVPVTIYQWFDQAVMRTVNIDLTGKPAWAWAWAAVAPFTLTGGVDYVILEAVAYGVGFEWSEVAPTTVPLCTNIQSVYRNPPPDAFYPVQVGAQYVGLDLGWN